MVASCLATWAQTQASAKPSAAIPLPTLPATQATGTPDTAPRQLATRPAQVQFTNGRLAVVANNSSLNQILRDISRETGIKVTGGVAEERVFGSYGPADPSRILATLLDGTGSNMLLIDGAGPGTRELILTPRTGGVSPPGPSGAFNRMNSADESDLPPDQRARRFGGPSGSNGLNPQQQPPNNNNPGAVPAFNPNQPAAGQIAPADDSPTAPPSALPPDTTQQQSPNGVKTPQQIYDQLIQLQQQQAKPQ